MRLKKAIEKIAFPYILLLSTFSIFAKLVGGYLLLPALVFLALIPFAFVLINSKHKYLLSNLVVFIISIIGAIALFFRQIRDVIPDVPISETTSVGYAQYFGYPLYLDNIIFLIIIFSPFVFFGLVKVFHMVTNFLIKHEK